MARIRIGQTIVGEDKIYQIYSYSSDSLQTEGEGINVQDLVLKWILPG